MAEIYYDSTFGLLQEVANTGKSKNRNEKKYGVYLLALAGPSGGAV